MDLFETIESRRSIRKYTGSPVSDEQLRQVLEAGRLAPSWKNLQCWSIVVVSDPALRKALGEAVSFNPDRTAYERAPYVLALCADPEKSGRMNQMDYYLVDSGIVMEHMVLAAHAMGLGTCCVGWFPEAPVKELLKVPSQLHVVALTPLGVPDQAPAPRPRKRLEDIAWRDSFGKPF